MNQHGSHPAKAHGRRYVNRYAGDVLLHAADSEGTPVLRKLVSEVQWKRPPSSNLRAEVSV